MPFARLSLSAVAAAGLSLAFGSAPAQAQYADDPPYGYDHPAPGYYPPAPAYGQPPADEAYAPPAYNGYYTPPPYAAPESTVGEVIIIAPYHHHRREVDPATGAPIERISASRRVRFDDLDLNTDWGVRQLHYRVVRAAHDACDSLDRHYDVLDSDDGDCVADAVRNAMNEAPIGEGVDAAYEGP